MDEEGHQLASSEKSPPTGTIPRGTLGYGVYALACGQLTGQETRIDDPLAHAGGYFHRQYATVQNRPTSPDNGQAGTAPLEGGTEVGAPGQPGEAAGEWAIACTSEVMHVIGAVVYARGGPRSS